MEFFWRISLTLCLVGQALSLIIETSPARDESAEGADSLILGGSNTALYRWGWVLSLEVNNGTAWAHHCGASLLKARYGLTSAHCVDGFDAADLRVIAGLHDRREPIFIQYAYLYYYKTHEDYRGEGSGTTLSSDIAILAFSNSINIGGNVGMGFLPDDDDDFAGNSCVIVGWGYTSSSNGLADVLQEARVDVLQNSECSSQLLGQAVIGGGHICTGDANKSISICTGDEGGPLICTPKRGGYVIAGVASFSIGSGNTCLTVFPSVFARGSTYANWVHQNTP